MRVERELMRGAGPIAVITLLEQREMYGYELVEALSQETGGVLAMGQSNLYPLLCNLEAKGLIRGKWAESESGLGVALLAAYVPSRRASRVDPIIALRAE